MQAAEILMRQIVKAFENGDLRPLFDSIDENGIVWKSGSAQGGPFRFGGSYAKRGGVVEVTSQLATGWSFQCFKPKEIVSKGNVVWGLFEVAGEFRPDGDGAARPFEYECALRWRVQGGKIVEHQAFFDTYELFRQVDLAS